MWNDDNDDDNVIFQFIWYNYNNPHAETYRWRFFLVFFSFSIQNFVRTIWTKKNYVVNNRFDSITRTRWWWSIHLIQILFFCAKRSIKCRLPVQSWNSIFFSLEIQTKKKLGFKHILLTTVVTKGNWERDRKEKNPPTK